MGKLSAERRALAAALVALFGFLYLLLAMGTELGLAFGALSAIYGIGFLGVVAGYFWARWFVVGLGLSGFFMGTLVILQLGFLVPAIVFFAAAHLAISALLWGNNMAKFYDGKQEWRQKFHLDESATHKLGKSVIRIGVSLPYMVLGAFVPRDGSELAFVAGVAVLAGAWGLTRMRSWSMLAVGAGSLLMLGSSALEPSLVPLNESVYLNLSPLLFAAAGFSMLAVLPFVGPMFNFLRAND